ncbi:hypothetical protein ACFL0W_02570 [Nanoarchaeota archaeon]
MHKRETKKGAKVVDARIAPGTYWIGGELLVRLNRRYGPLPFDVISLSPESAMELFDGYGGGLGGIPINLVGLPVKAHVEGFRVNALEVPSQKEARYRELETSIRSLYERGLSDPGGQLEVSVSGPIFHDNFLVLPSHRPDHQPDKYAWLREKSIIDAAGMPVTGCYFGGRLIDVKPKEIQDY